MRVFRDSNEQQWGQDSKSFSLGALGGLALGVLVSRALPQPRRVGTEIRDRARTVARRLRPARLRRYAVEQEELDQLEDTVLRAFLDDPVLSERGVDIGAISHGIIELSGSVWTDDEADRAVSLTNGIPGVRTVVNRLELETASGSRMGDNRFGTDEVDSTFVHQGSRTGGMGRSRQGPQTEPDRTDDSQHQRERALALADRDQYGDEGLAHESPRMNERPEVQSTDRTDYREDELDNQDPHGKHTSRTLDSPPEERNSEARVGDGTKPGTQRRIDEADPDRASD